ncbi:MAG: DNA mismatch repair protein MutS [Candidatus Heimdallarchaeota archaeon]|nr:DNA mismatch repair protein MutS [Candidatus Heimdallarchaeota archaeon]
MTKLTPMQRQFRSFKRKYPDCLILFRVGDFFELFGDDAKLGAKVLGITLTSRSGEPLAGVPVKAADAYLATLVKHGYKVAVVDQLEDASQAKGLVKRGVVRIITPGTITDGSMLNANENNFIVSLFEKNKEFGLALADVSTGEFCVTDFVEEEPLENLLIELNRISPAECLVAEKNNHSEKLFAILEDTTITPLEPYRFSFDNAYKLLTEHFKTTSLEGFGCEKKPLAISAAGALLDYLRETQKTKLDNVRTLRLYSTKGNMIVDPASFRSLELLKNVRDNSSKGTLIEILDKSCTAMGGRFIRRAIRRPLTIPEKINERLAAVEELVGNSFLREDLRGLLDSIQDLERLASQISLRRANARDVISIKTSLKIVPKLVTLLEQAETKALTRLREELCDMSPLISLIEKAIKDNPSANLTDGGIIKKDYHEELDELRDLAEGGRKWVLNYELEQKSETGIKALKIGFNNMLGYYIQVGKNYLNLVPDHYVPKQELKNSKRYITSQLKDYEAKILNAKEQINDLEYELFCEIREKIHEEISPILVNAEKIAELDCLATFAEVSRNNAYIRPDVNDSLSITITQGRHPVVEKMLVDEPFIPNDTTLNCDSDQILIVTGPNMSGKCVTGDTLIFSDRGILPIIDFRPDNSEEGSFVELTTKIRGITGVTPTSHFYADGVRSSIRITTKHGYSLEGSLNHPVLVRTPAGKESWKKLSEIQEDDYLIINRTNNLWGSNLAIHYPSQEEDKQTTRGFPLPTKLTEDLGYLLGLLVGGGRLTDEHGYTFTTSNQQLVEAFRKINKTVFNCPVKTRKQATELFASSHSLRDFLAFLGLDYLQTSRQVVPKSVLQAPKDIIKAFLQGLFDTAGRAEKQSGRVVFSTPSNQLAKQVHVILLNFGISSSLKAINSPGSSSYEISLAGEAAVNFYDAIGFRLPEKQQRQNLINLNPGTTEAGIPYLTDPLTKIRKRIVEKSKSIPPEEQLQDNEQMENLFHSALNQKQNLSYPQLRELIDYCTKYRIDHQEVKTISNNNYFYDEIVKIEHSRAPLFDFSVPEGHAFVGNGVINHNSTYIRQIALIALMAQIGCFVPAEKAKIGVVDRIFTRIGASDDISKGLSTFLVEMNETANILNNATKRSLIVLDEVGRGTSTFDGVSIAWAVAEYIHNSQRLGSRTVFATHYHQLIDLEQYLERVKNYSVLVKKKADKILFLHKIAPGGTDKSYGIQVAKLSGMPVAVINRAKEILDYLEAQTNDATIEEITAKGLPKKASIQTTLFGQIAAGEAAAEGSSQKLPPATTLFQSPRREQDRINEEIISEIRELTIENLTPLEALNQLNKIKKRIAQNYEQID